MKKHHFYFATKAIAIFLLAMCIPLSAYSANAGDKKISLNLSNAPIKKFFDTISTQANVDFIYNSATTNGVKPITLSVKNEPLKSVLDNVFKKLGLEYSIEGNIITVRRSSKMPPHTTVVTITSTPNEVAMKKTVSGVVKDEMGDLLPGVSIWVKGTKIGLATDIDGAFTLTIPDDVKSPELRFSYIGMEDQDVKCHNKTTFNITMHQSAHALKETEVIATGMFTRKAESFTGAVSTFDSDQLKRVGNKNLLSSLKNLDPSFVINESVDFGSDPNKMPDMQIRGQSSIPDIKGEYQTEPNQPLFILDGFETTVEKVYDLDMNLVKSVTLLKDAAAKAIYGSKAANGVVVIETIQPVAGRLRLSYTGSLDITAPDLSSYNLTNSAEKLQAEVLAGKYTSSNAYTQSQLTDTYNELYKEVARGVDTYWMSQPLRTGIGQKHTIYLDGGDDAMRYSASLGYNNIAGVMKGSDRTTISGSITLSYRYKSLQFRNQLSIDNNKAKNSPYGSFSLYSSMNPYYRIYNEDGSLIKSYGTNIYNPLYNAGLNSKDETAYTTITENFYAEWEAFKNFRIRARFGLTSQVNSSDVFKPASHTDYANIAVTSDEYLLRGQYNKANGKQRAISSDIGAAYSFEINQHLLYANASWTLEDSHSETTSMVAVGFPSDRMSDISFGSAYQTGSKPTGSESTSRSTGVVISANYSYANRYLADVSYRLTGSSMFGAKDRWGNFWSAGIGWNMHQEAFMKNVKAINFLKIRASLGYTGSQNFSSYQAIATYNYITDRTYNGDIGAILLALANENLKWQQQYDRNVGIDISLFNKLSIRGDFYYATTKNLLTDVTLAPSTGFSSYKENMGETENKGLELAVNYHVFSHAASRSSLSIFANVAHNTNKISKISNALKKMNEEQDAEKDNNNSTSNKTNPSTRFEEGQSLSAIWAVPSAGIDPITGKEVFISKDGTTTYTWSSADQVVCGDTQPTLNGNFGAYLQLYGFGLNVSMSYKLGGQTYNSTLVSKIENADVLNSNVDKRVLTDRWNTPGVAAKYKSITDHTTTKPTSRFVEDFNELALSSLNLTYDFDRMKWLKRTPIQQVKLTFNMSDVFWLCSVSKEQGLSYPRARTFSFGLQVRF